MIQVCNQNFRLVSAGHCEFIGRPSLLGNPYRIGRDGNRKQVIGKFRTHLEEHLKNPDSPITRRIIALASVARSTDLYLICFCAPQPCHGDVIKETIERMNASLTGTG